MTGPDASRREIRRTWLVLGLILMLAAALRVLSFRGYTSHDASAYAQLAHMMVSGGFKPGMMWYFPVFSVRVGLFAPVALAFRLGGVNEATLTLYPFLCSMICVLLAYLAARAIFGNRAGLIAACLAALLPIDMRFATQLYPDLPAAFWMNAGVLLIYAGSRQRTVASKFALGALAGLALFASWLCKETVLYLLPFVGSYMFWLLAKDRCNLALLSACTVVAGLLVGIEGWVYYRATGDFLFRWSALRRNAQDLASVLPVFNLAHTVRYVEHRTIDVLREALLNAYFAFTPVVALTACVYALLRASRRFLFPALWFCWLLLVFGFGSGSLRAYVPLNLHVARFQYPMLLPAILLASGFAGSMLAPPSSGEAGRSHRTRFFSRVLLLTYLAVVCALAAGFGIHDGMGRRSRVQRAMAHVLAPTDPLYTDGSTAAALRFFWKYPVDDSVRDFQGMAAAQVPPGAHVLLDRSELTLIRNIDKYVPPEFLDSVPPTWQKLRDKDNATLYRVPAATLADSAQGLWKPSH
jgi:4-amino-4-deoxy-L-arabinose transferase-like glycosyltransferase